MEMRQQKIFAGLTTMRFLATEDTEKTEDILEIEFRGPDNTEFFCHGGHGKHGRSVGKFVVDANTPKYPPFSPCPPWQKKMK